MYLQNGNRGGQALKYAFWEIWYSILMALQMVSSIGLDNSFVKIDWAQAAYQFRMYTCVTTQSEKKTCHLSKIYV